MTVPILCNSWKFCVICSNNTKLGYKHGHDASWSFEFENMWFQCSRFSLKFGVAEISQKLACSVCGVAEGLFIGSLNRGKIQKHGRHQAPSCSMVRMHLQLVTSKFAMMCLYSCYWYPVLLLKQLRSALQMGRVYLGQHFNSQHPVSSLMHAFRKKWATAILFVEQQNKQ